MQNEHLRARKVLLSVHFHSAVEETHLNVSEYFNSSKQMLTACFFSDIFMYSILGCIRGSFTESSQNKTCNVSSLQNDMFFFFSFSGMNISVLRSASNRKQDYEFHQCRSGSLVHFFSRHVPHLRSSASYFVPLGLTLLYRALPC